MTNTAAPERATRIPTVGETVIVTTGTYDTHQGTIEGVGLYSISVRLDITGDLRQYDFDQLVFVTGERLETSDERDDRERRARTAERLHKQAQMLRPIVRTRESAIIAMAQRYGAAERLKGGDTYDIDLTYRAADRRFSALQRLVYGD